jgi:hypothetical protein
MAGIWTWSEKNQQRWSATRAKGKWHFVLVKGVLMWGGLMFLFMAVSPVVFGFPHRVSILPPDYWIWQPLLWAAGGFGWGLWVWSSTEKKYIAHERKTSNP